MATTNRVYSWEDGDRLFVDVNGATIEAQSLMFDQQIVTLKFRATVAAPNNAVDIGGLVGHVCYDDPLLDECLW